MAKAKKKLLPKDFDALLKTGDIAALKAVFEECDVNARGGYSKQTALAFSEFPDELVQWLVSNGADISAPDTYGETPLHSRARHWQGRIEVLLDLGADVHAGENGRGTPLHSAASSYNAKTARLLIEHGARVDALNRENQTPLALALQRCRNSDIERMAEVAELLVGDGLQQGEAKKGFLASIFGKGNKAKTHQTPELKSYITRIGTEFEFHRRNFNPECIDATDAALVKLYTLFDVSPVPPRAMHDGKSPIVAQAKHWEDRHQELWEMLVPSQGAADTVQGEVVRIPGKIRDELDGNGGGNWDADFKRMADAFLILVGTGVPLPKVELNEASSLVTEIKARRGDTRRMCELGVNWVALNPKPAKLPTPDYRR
ncbi:MAG: ankyrin repeat domain-containing protein [Sphingomonadales bacterium]|nr:ankyrin repeat domain-containing protein [Sphingomonadales bacterium]